MTEWKSSKGSRRRIKLWLQGAPSSSRAIQLKSSNLLTPRLSRNQHLRRTPTGGTHECFRLGNQKAYPCDPYLRIAYVGGICRLSQTPDSEPSGSRLSIGYCHSDFTGSHAFYARNGGHPQNRRQHRQRGNGET